VSTAIPHQPVGAAHVSAKRPKVLVVDDETIMRELLRLHLRTGGYDVQLAEDAVEAGHLILRLPPDVILLDVHMPYMDGYEFAAALKGDPATRHIPIIFLTTDETVEENAPKLGAAGYLKKPVMANRLLELVSLVAKSLT